MEKALDEVLIKEEEEAEAVRDQECKVRGPEQAWKDRCHIVSTNSWTRLGTGQPKSKEILADAELAASCQVAQQLVL
eukprot:766762-Hanusia_phi.AAC.7